jgi:hypothetical protein
LRQITYLGLQKLSFPAVISINYGDERPPRQEDAGIPGRRGAGIWLDEVTAMRSIRGDGAFDHGRIC